VGQVVFCGLTSSPVALILTVNDSGHPQTGMNCGSRETPGGCSGCDCRESCLLRHELYEGEELAYGLDICEGGVSERT
jgi:hypothetical protein